jgi:hypothetical protein
MQYWIYYLPGVGGDGFRNLLEFGSNVELPDDEPKSWKCWKHPNGKIQFENRFIAQDRAAIFKNTFLDDGSRLMPEKIELKEKYVDLVNAGKNVVLNSHPFDWIHQMPKFKYQDIVLKDQHRILLYSNNKQRIYEDAATKLWVGISRTTKEEQDRILEWFWNEHEPITYLAEEMKYNTYIDIERVWTDWDYLDNILKNIGIDLDKKYYDEYLYIIGKRKTA